MKITLIDNFDSFAHNLARYFVLLGCEVSVVRNDVGTVDDLFTERPDAFVISPGPKAPEQTGHVLPLLERLDDKIPVLGVCLGHQAIAVAFGGVVTRSPEPRHGKTSPIHHRGEGIFRDLPAPFPATRYHSLIVDPQRLPPELTVTARTDDGLVMGIAHRERPIYGVQFHPESVLTRHGFDLLANFLKLSGFDPQPVRSEDREPLTQPTDLLPPAAVTASPPLPVVPPTDPPL